ncbi:endo-beta-glucanase [Amanita muscaria]
MKLYPTLLFLLGTVTSAVLGTSYFLHDEVVGWDFYTHFDFQNIPDPTHGRVLYVDRPTAITQNLTYACSDAFILRADDKTILDPEGPGRMSVRLQSFRRYKNTVLVWDIRHMPQGCGTWPAVWTDGPDWPNGGEIDIIEGVNDQSPNSATLHTNANCTMVANRPQLGTVKQDDCDVSVNFNAGCGVSFPTSNSYGPAFNQNGGGWYAMERSPTHIRVWFWPRDGPVPEDVRYNEGEVEPDHWGTPTAYFPSTSCDIQKHFTAQWIIINLTFCGDWAGNVYGTSGCPGTCVDYVNNHPEAFSEAYFDFASLRIYKPFDYTPSVSVNVTLNVTIDI